MENMDDIDNIKKCLDCKYSECINCLDENLVKDSDRQRFHMIYFWKGKDRPLTEICKMENKNYYTAVSRLRRFNDINFAMSDLRLKKWKDLNNVK